MIPRELQAPALLVLGATAGSQFKKYKLRDLLRMFSHSLITVAMLFAISAFVASAVSLLTGIPFLSALLAFSPGEITEMSLIALALDIAPAYLAIHHLARIALCVFIAPFIGQWAQRR